jgi:hypothetical protein
MPSDEEAEDDVVSVLRGQCALSPPHVDDVCGKPVNVGDGGGGIWVQINFYREEIARKLSSKRIRAPRKGNTAGTTKKMGRTKSMASEAAGQRCQAIKSK